MGFKAKDMIIHVRKGSVFFMRIVCRSLPDHPFICIFLFFLFILYRHFPSLFAFVISSSPVVICAALLLGILLVYGDTSIPDSDTTVRPQIVVKSIFLPNSDTHAASKKEIESNDACDSNSELDSEVNSSPDASVADIIPSLDELHPLLDSEAPETALRSVDDSEQKSDDDSIDEELDNQEDDEEEEEEEDAHEEKDDVNEEVLKWTADDQKNLIDLGTSELERNRRLENLIAKRKARKFLSFHEKSLIDLDISDPVPNTENNSNSQLNVQIPSIFAPRRNPFDVSFEDESNTGIPPIPGSAPSILQPRHSPFFTPFNHGEENQNLFFARNGDFSTGAPSSSSNMKPYFVAENAAAVSTEKDDSTVSSDDESDSTLSETEEVVHNELIEPEIRSVSHVAVLGNQYDVASEVDSQSSEVDSVDDSNDQTGADENIHNGGLNASNDAAVEIEIRQGEYNGHEMGDEDLDEIDDESYVHTSSSSSEADDNQSTIFSDDPVQTTITTQDSNKSDQEIDNNSSIFPDDGHVPEPVYDSSPTAAEKTTIDHTLLFPDKEGEDPSTDDQKANSSLSSVDEKELRSREVTDIKEREVFRINIPRTNDHEHIPSPVMPRKYGIARRLSVSSIDSLSNSELSPIPEEQPEFLKPAEEDSNVAVQKDASSSNSVNVEKVRNISKFW